jgi:hypothetical protein
LNQTALPLAPTRQSFAPSIVAAEVVVTNIMMLSVLIAIFTYVNPMKYFSFARLN